jgi:hypothetical protein
MVNQDCASTSNQDARCVIPQLLADEDEGGTVLAVWCSIEQHWSKKMQACLVAAKNRNSKCAVADLLINSNLYVMLLLDMSL